jgi:UDP-N-acetyl-D-mannosaminuronate dehydrogenase
LLSAVYGRVTEGRVYLSAIIRTAVAEKIIGNTQRDLNIALMNDWR